MSCCHTLLIYMGRGCSFVFLCFDSPYCLGKTLVQQIVDHVESSKPFFNLKFFLLPDLYCRLTKLSLKENCLSDTSIRKLTIPQRLLKGGLGKLSILDLSSNPSITDDSIKHIIKLDTLTALNLSGTKVTFGYGVPQLMNHTNLGLALDVSYTNRNHDIITYFCALKASVVRYRFNTLKLPLIRISILNTRSTSCSTLDQHLSQQLVNNSESTRFFETHNRASIDTQESGDIRPTLNPLPKGSPFRC